jgi:hypothetical protein
MNAKTLSSALLLVVACAFSARCAPLYLPHQPARYGPRVAPSPVGQWHAVVGLDRATLIGVVTADGVAHSGRFVSAARDWLRLYENGAELEIPRDHVIQVDLLRRSAHRIEGNDVLGGAVAGALALAATEALLGTAFGGKLWVPRARTWAVGATGGAVAGAIGSLARHRERTIYVAPY